MSTIFRRQTESLLTCSLITEASLASSAVPAGRCAFCRRLSWITSSLLDGVSASAHLYRLLCLRAFRDNSLFPATYLSFYSRFRSVFGQGVLDLQNSIIDLSTIILLDTCCCRCCFQIDYGCRAQVLSVHVLVKADGDELAALRKQSLSIRDGDVFLVNVADLELALWQVSDGLEWLRCFLLLLSLFLASTLRLFEKQHIIVRVELFASN